MSSDPEVVARAVRRALTGTGAHVEAGEILAGLGWKRSGERTGGAPHSVFQLLNHMIYWNDWVVHWLDGKEPPLPRHAAGSWPGGTRPANRQEWERAVHRFRGGLDALDKRAQEADLLSRRGRKTTLEMLQTIASHTSYHVGQVVFLRKMLGRWPPRSGGLTW